MRGSRLGRRDARSLARAVGGRCRRRGVIGWNSQDDKLAKAHVHVHHFDPAVKSVLGIPGDYDIHFSENILGETITGTALVANQPQHSLRIRLTKGASL